MKIGVFDSGLGGLLVAETLRAAMPAYDYLYYGDTAHLPYGEKTQDQLYRLTKEGLDYLFRNNCKLVIIACNTASAEALRKIQQQDLPQLWPDRKVLGVIIPTVEAALNLPKIRTIGVLATRSTVRSGAFRREINKLRPGTNIIQKAAPLLATAIEKNDGKLIQNLLDRYLSPLTKAHLDVLILGSTHYGHVAQKVRSYFPPDVQIISADTIIAEKLSYYLKQHPEIENCLTTHATFVKYLTGR